ncbi:hypothetical protein ID866_5414 [Astraeus odoratus]|nr:hypothetical protein ID866_5414 [Astraeus odoratus]
MIVLVLTMHQCVTHVVGKDTQPREPPFLSIVSHFMDSRELKQKLETWISEINFEAPEYDARAHRLIYNEVETIAGAPEDDSSPGNIPPALVFYAIRNFLHPTFIVGQIPDLCNLLTMVDVFRQYAVKKSGDMLTWNTYYSKNLLDLDVRLLSEKEVLKLERYRTQSQLQRKEYFLLLRNLFQVYIHYLWTAPESSLLPMRLNDFFPGSMAGTKQPSSLLFHHDLSDDEKHELAELHTECKTWLTAIDAWQRERKELGEQQGYSEAELQASYKDDFQAAFPRPVEYADLAVVVQQYLKSVEDMIHRLEAWFPPSSTSNE